MVQPIHIPTAAEQRETVRRRRALLDGGVSFDEHLKRAASRRNTHDLAGRPLFDEHGRAITDWFIQPRHIHGISELAKIRASLRSFSETYGFLYLRTTAASQRCVPAPGDVIPC